MPAASRPSTNSRRGVGEERKDKRAPIRWRKQFEKMNARVSPHHKLLQMHTDLFLRVKHVLVLFFCSPTPPSQLFFLVLSHSSGNREPRSHTLLLPHCTICRASQQTAGNNHVSVTNNLPFSKSMFPLSNSPTKKMTSPPQDPSDA